MSQHPASAPDPHVSGGRSGPTRRTVLQGAGALAGAALLAACGASSAPGSGKHAGGAGPVARSSSTSASGSNAVTLTDQRGKTLHLPHPARRVVTLPMPAAAILIAVDQGVDHLVGMHDASWLAIKDGVLGQLFPQALAVAHDVANNDFVPNVESVLALHPDLVVQWADAGAGIITPLENAGLPVLGLTYGTQQDLTTWINLFAAMLGKPQRARELNSLTAQRLQLAKRVGRHAPRPRPSILYFNRFLDGLKVAGAQTYNDFYIRLVGGTNPASGPAPAPAQGMVGVDTEQVLAWDPDIILLGNFDAAMPSDVYGQPVWKSLRAVRTRRVYKVPLGGYRWDPPSHESPLMWQWLSQVAFPGRSPWGDLRAQVVRDYTTFYGRRPTNAQMDEILWMKENAQSAHYDQFGAGRSSAA